MISKKKIAVPSECSMEQQSRCHCINLRRAANAVTDYYDRALADTGITVSQYSLLSNIGKIEPCSVAELSRLVRLERTTLVRNLKLLYEAEWIQNDAAPGSRKGKIHLTDAGRKLAAAAKVRWLEAQEDIEAFLGEEELRLLTDCLLKLEQLNFQHEAP